VLLVFAGVVPAVPDGLAVDDTDLLGVTVGLLVALVVDDDGVADLVG
jgi:hypothetical protein